MPILTETANNIIKGYFEQYPAELEALRGADSEKKFQSHIYNIEDTIKNELDQNRYEFDDLLTLLLRGEDEELNNDFSDWFRAFCPDSTDILTFIKAPETLLLLLICDKIDYYAILGVLSEVYGIEPPKPAPPSDDQILSYINNFCLVHENISKNDIIRVLGGLKND